jgi:hypothetical protein
LHAKAADITYVLKWLSEALPTVMRPAEIALARFLPALVVRDIAGSESQHCCMSNAGCFSS